MFVFGEEDEHEEALYGRAKPRPVCWSRNCAGSTGSATRRSTLGAQVRRNGGGGCAPVEGLETENARQKKPLAEAMLDMEALNVVVRESPKPASQAPSSGGDSGEGQHL